VKIESKGVGVQLAPDIIGWVPFETMRWARPFKPGGASAAPRSTRDVVKLGDVVQTLATKVGFRRGAMREK